MHSLSAFDIFILNYKNPSCLQDIKNLCQLRIIDKSTNEFAMNLIKSFKLEYNGKKIPYIPSMRKEVVCTKCNIRKTKKTEAFTQKPLCYICYPKYITLTDAKKIYKLKEQDLNKIDHTRIYIGTYRIYATLYQKTDIYSLCMLKYGRYEPIRKERGLAREKRLQKFYSLYDKYIIDNNYNKYICDIFEEFIRNGNGGFRNLETNMKKWPEYISFMKSNNPTFQIKSYFTLYKKYILESCKLDEIQTNINKRKEYVDTLTEYNINHQTKINYIETDDNKLMTIVRKHDLEKALGLYGIKIHIYSVVCDEYINGSEDAYDFEKTVNIMRTMKFLYTETTYDAIYTDMLNAEYQNAKEQIFEEYGYIRNSNEYDNLLYYYVDKQEISQTAKHRAVHGFKNLPDYFVF